MKNNKTLLILVAATLMLITFISAKNQETKNPVYEYLTITKGPINETYSTDWEITFSNNVITIERNRAYRKKYKDNTFILSTINQYEKEGWELFTYNVYSYSSSSESAIRPEHHVVMRKKIQ